MFWKKPSFSIKAYPPGAQPEAPPPPPEAKARFVAVPTPPRRRCVAFIVVHGMGQQVPYETLSMLAENMVTQEAKLGQYQQPPSVSVVRAKITDDPDDPPLARAQFSVIRKAEGKDEPEMTDVHIFEAYWAPLTEGKISLIQVVSFLFNAAGRGIWSSLRSGRFRRWMFGDFQELPIKAGTLYALVATAVAFAIALAPLLLFNRYWKDAVESHFHAVVIKNHPVASLLLLAVLGLYSWLVPYFLVEYAGDVAIYVSSYKVSSFEETRSKIQEAAFAIARQVFSSTTGPTKMPTYDKVVFVGHSLGSVIAYDTLNAAICWDKAEMGGRINVVGRTSRLITFGSPLDKTAFLFRTQVSGPRWLREALAAQKQPLILDYAEYRPRGSFHWVNIYSRADIISGRLIYYDLPAGSANPARNPVENVIDWQACVPIVAHIQYWQTQRLREELYKAI